MSEGTSILRVVTRMLHPRDALPTTLGHATFTPGQGWIYMPQGAPERATRHPKPTLAECLRYRRIPITRARTYWVQYQGAPVDQDFRADPPCLGGAP